MTDAADFAAQLSALRKHYARQIEGTLDELVSRVSGHEAGCVHREMLVELHAGLHKLAGSGGTFGFSELSRQARLLEVTAKAWLDDSIVPELVQWEAWKTDLLRLRRALEVPEEKEEATASMPESKPESEQDSPIRVVLIEDDEAAGAELSKGLSQFGYEVMHYTNFAEAEVTILASPPDVLVADIILSKQVSVEGTDATTLLYNRLGYLLPTIFITSRADFSARLSAAKAGGSACLIKPVDIPVLARCITMLQQERELAPYRVLIVDDDEGLAEHYRLTLMSAGMLAEKVSRPKEVLTALQKFHPDILLIDLYMPECTGAQLARAIRYEDTWLSTPIIYLSAEDDLDEQVKALDIGGGDDFLTKPIVDQKLVAVVRTRAARARKVDELMSKDSLTGLLKHSSIKERIEQEFERARRSGKIMSMAMVDMDHFKRVNDTWGHPMGDQVIKTLAHLLRQRLRRQDSIGRYGGEEFAVVLPECDAANAMKLLDDVRLRFGDIRFVHNGQSFAVTLSAGVADSEQCADAQGLLAAADAALYVAKNGGRNQVCRFEDVADSASQ
ncbi:MAG TPA: diguanylate cyclase [Methylobacter sp.]